MRKFVSVRIYFNQLATYRQVRRNVKRAACLFKLHQNTLARSQFCHSEDKGKESRLGFELDFKLGLELGKS